MNDMEVVSINVYSCDRSWIIQPEAEELSVKTIGDRMYIRCGDKLQLDLPQEHTIVEYFYLGEQVEQTKEKNYREIMKEKVRSLLKLAGKGR